MNQPSIELLSFRSAGETLAGLGPSHGYRFDGDTVHLRAMFTGLNPEAHQRSWALQLWACPQAPSADTGVVGFLVAEAPLPPIGELVDERESFEVAAFACPPAGTASHVMVLVLVAGLRGHFDEVHDFATYQRREEFTQPRLAGRVGFALNGDRVSLEVEHIENPRDAANLSGTLSLELWALETPYRGGAFSGVPLAGVLFGPIAGGNESSFKSFELPYSAPPAGCWQFVVMLREWTAAGFITRDYSNFPLPVTIAEAITPGLATELPRTMQQPAAQKSPEPKTTIRKRGANSRAKSKTKPDASKESKANTAAISVNKASREELESIAGIPARVVDVIIARRPFHSLDELGKVKGVSGKLLGTLRSRLKL